MILFCPSLPSAEITGVHHHLWALSSPTFDQFPISSYLLHTAEREFKKNLYNLGFQKFEVLSYTEFTLWENYVESTNENSYLLYCSKHTSLVMKPFPSNDCRLNWLSWSSSEAAKTSLGKVWGPSCRQGGKQLRVHGKDREVTEGEMGKNTKGFIPKTCLPLARANLRAPIIQGKCIYWAKFPRVAPD